MKGGWILTMNLARCRRFVAPASRRLLELHLPARCLRYVTQASRRLLELSLPARCRRYVTQASRRLLELPLPARCRRYVALASRRLLELPLPARCRRYGIILSSNTLHHPQKKTTIVLEKTEHLSITTHNGSYCPSGDDSISEFICRCINGIRTNCS
jgi:hypothetical protein